VTCLDLVYSSSVMLIRDNNPIVEAAQNGLKWPGGKIDEYALDLPEISFSITLLTLRRNS
jgi:hypothetical protein